MEVRQPDGATLRQHLTAVERNTRRQVPQLHVHCPAGTEHIWAWFKSLEKGRAVSGVGLAPVSYAEIGAWCGLLKIRPTVEEVETLKTMDGLLVAILGVQHER